MGRCALVVLAGTWIGWSLAWRLIAVPDGSRIALPQAAFGVAMLAGLWHQYGHANEARWLGIPVRPTLAFTPLLGEVHLNRLLKSRELQARVGVAGPLSWALSSLVTILHACLVGSHTVTGATELKVAAFSLILCMINLATVWPFDGSRMGGTAPLNLLFGLILCAVQALLDLLVMHHLGLNDLGYYVVLAVFMTHFSCLWEVAEQFGERPQMRRWHFVAANFAAVLVIVHGLAVCYFALSTGPFDLIG